MENSNIVIFPNPYCSDVGADGPLIGVDIDGVLADFNSYFLARVNNLLGTSYEKHHVTTYDYHECMPEITKEKVYQVFDEMVEDGSYGILETMEGYLHINALPGTVRLITNRQAGCAGPTEDWLVRHGVKKHRDLVFVKGKKSQMGEFDYFIEDSLANALDMAAVCKHVYLIDHPYNQTSLLPENVTRVSGWEELIDILKAVVLTNR